MDKIEIDKEVDARKIYNFISIGSKYVKTSQIINSFKVLKRHDYVVKLFELICDYKKAEEIEESIFEFSLVHINNNNFNESLFGSVYKDKFNELYVNLDITNKKINNLTLLPKIMDGTIKCKELAFLLPKDLHEESFKQLLEKREIATNILTGKLNSITGVYTCKRCKGQKFQLITKQTRSGDEPETKFFTCMDCGLTFRK